MDNFIPQVDLPPYKVCQPVDFREYRMDKRINYLKSLGVSRSRNLGEKVYKSVSTHIDHIDIWQPNVYNY